MLRASTQPIPPALKSALELSLGALQSKDAGAQRRAAAAMTALPSAWSELAVRYLAALGDHPAALRKVEEAALDGNNLMARAWLFEPAMAPALRDPTFPALADKLGLIRYWKTSGTKPDACKSAQAPPFCATI